jgi:transposase
MRGDDEKQPAIWSYVLLEDRIPDDHPLRRIRRMVDEILERLSPRFSEMYSQAGRPSIPPEQLLRALLLQVLYTIRSERQLMEQLGYNLLFRWFVGLRMDDPVWVPTVFTKNRRRLLEGEVARASFEEVLGIARRQDLLSDEHFTVDGTLIEAWAGQKSFRKKDVPAGGEDDKGNPTVDFHGEKRTNETHRSTTDPEARLYRKGPGKEAKLCYLGHVLTDNRFGLVVDTCVTMATGRAEVQAAQAMLDRRRSRKAGRITLGADKGYDTRGFVQGMRDSSITPHVAQSSLGRRSAVDGRTTGREGYAVSQKKRKLVEQVFGWLKTIGPLRKTKLRGVARVGWMFAFSAAVYNLLRISNMAAGVS